VRSRLPQRVSAARGDGGSAVVEFVVVVPLLLLLVLGVLQVGLALHVRATVTAAAAEGHEPRLREATRLWRGRGSGRAVGVARLGRGRVGVGHARSARRTGRGRGAGERAAAARRSARPDGARRCRGTPSWRGREIPARRQGGRCSEVLVLGTGLLVPLLYGVLSVMAVQSASFAATAAARDGARLRHRLAAEGGPRPRGDAAGAGDAGVPVVAPRSGCAGTCLAPGRVSTSP
jgi:hypothetical protein